MVDQGGFPGRAASRSGAPAAPAAWSVASGLQRDVRSFIRLLRGGREPPDFERLQEAISLCACRWREIDVQMCRCVDV